MLAHPLKCCEVTSLGGCIACMPLHKIGPALLTCPHEERLLAAPSCTPDVFCSSVPGAALGESPLNHSCVLSLGCR